MKVLFAHNTLSSYKPKNLISKLFSPWSKCQSKNISELYKSGVRGFDIRIRCPHNEPSLGDIGYVIEPGDLIACHGLADYDVDIQSVFRELDALSKQDNEKIYIRLINEDTFRNSNSHVFMHYARLLMEYFPDFIYQVYSSNKKWKLEVNNFKELVFELCASKIFPFTPKYFADKNKAQYTYLYKNLISGFLFLDFI